MASVCDLLKMRESGLSSQKGLTNQNKRRITNKGTIAPFSQFTNCPVQQSAQILRQAICSTNRTFRPLIKKSFPQKGPLIYSDGRIWSKNSGSNKYEVFDLRQLTSTSTPKDLFYSLPSQPRWIDQDIWSNPSIEKVCRSSTDHLSSLFVLRQHPKHCLERFDVWSGRQLDCIKLPESLKFLEMAFDEEHSTIVLKSKEHPHQMPRQKTNSILVTFLIFQFPPLNFKYHLEICSNIFAPGVVTDAEINHGILLVMYQSSEIELYSMDYLKKNCLVDGHQFTDISKVNLRMTSKPPVLFKILSSKHHLELSCFVPYLALKVQAQKNFIQLVDMLTGLPVENGNIARKDLFDESEVIFHPDGSPRIIHSQGSKFRVLLQDSTEHCLKEVFVFDASNERSVENLAPGATGVEDNAAVETAAVSIPSRSSFGRSIRRPANYQDLTSGRMSADSDSEEFSVAFHFENELDLIALLVYKDSIKHDDEDESDLVTRIEKVVLIDNFSLKILKEIPFGLELNKRQSVRSSLIQMDKDLLIIQESNSSISSFLPCSLKELNLTEDNKSGPKLRRTKHTTRS